MADAYILEAARTAIGRKNGALAHTRPDDLAAAALKGLVARAGVDRGTRWQRCTARVVAHSRPALPPPDAQTRHRHPRPGGDGEANHGVAFVGVGRRPELLRRPVPREALHL